jgi:hypothetical protein
VQIREGSEELRGVLHRNQLGQWERRLRQRERDVGREEQVQVRRVLPGGRALVPRIHDLDDVRVPQIAVDLELAVLVRVSTDLGMCRFAVRPAHLEGNGLSRPLPHQSLISEFDQPYRAPAPVRNVQLHGEI